MGSNPAKRATHHFLFPRRRESIFSFKRACYPETSHSYHSEKAPRRRIWRGRVVFPVADRTTAVRLHVFRSDDRPSSLTQSRNPTNPRPRSPARFFVGRPPQNDMGVCRSE